MSSIHTPIAEDDPTPVYKPQPLFGLKAPDATSTAIDAPAQAKASVPAPASEAIRLLLSRYEMSTGEPLPSVIAVTSAVRGEGVTTMSRSLASIMSSDLDADVCWIDLSWPSPSSKVPDRAPSPGISEVLRGSKNIDDVMHADPSQPRVNLVPLGGMLPADQSRLARSPQLAEVIGGVLKSHHHVVVDAGAVLDSTDALVAIRHADAYLLVVRHGSTSSRQVRTVVDELRTIPSLGALLNQYRTRTPAFVRNRFAR